MRELIKIAIMLLLFIAPFSVNAQTPYDRFEKLWTDFNLNYSYFQIKGVDWDAVKAKYSPLFQKIKSPKKEARLLGKVINELKDEHVSLQTQFGIYRYKKRIIHQTEESYESYFTETIIKNQTTHILSNKDRIVLIRVKNLDNEIISSDSIWKIIYNSKGLIIDLSDNGGGNEKYAREFLEHFVNDTLKFKSYRFTTGKGRNDFTDWKYGYLYPQSNSLFSGHIVGIINSTCYSSCEAFALMLKSLPNCSLIGLKTAGSSGYPKKFILDNGWTYTISTWQEADMQKNLIEDNGIFPINSIEMDRKYLIALKIINSEL